MSSSQGTHAANTGDEQSKHLGPMLKHVALTRSHVKKGWRRAILQITKASVYIGTCTWNMYMEYVHVCCERTGGGVSALSGLSGGKIGKIVYKRLPFQLAILAIKVRIQRRDRAQPPTTGHNWPPTGHESPMIAIIAIIAMIVMIASSHEAAKYAISLATGLMYPCPFYYSIPRTSLIYDC